MINVFIAIGTIGAVIVAFYINIYRKQKFIIKNIEPLSQINANKEENNLLFVDVQNLTDFPMEVIGGSLFFSGKGRVNDDGAILPSRQGMKWKYEDETVAPLSFFRA